MEAVERRADVWLREIIYAIISTTFMHEIEF